MKFHVPTGPLPLLPPYFVWIDTSALDWEEIDLSDLFRGSADEEFVDIDLAELTSGSR